ncbi:MAG: helix-turn-helix domain-containing protein [Acidobacteriia bacterium]|nr:helix-turn-helix domain-containing protein [Terriglobia bacterium]
MTGQDLADRARVSPSYISLIENGVKVPTEEVAEAIAVALGDGIELYRAWVQSGRIGDLEGAWARLHRARQYASSPALRRRLSSGEDLDAVAHLSPGPAAESERPAYAMEMPFTQEARHIPPLLVGAEAVLSLSTNPVSEAGPALVEVPVLRECADPGDDQIPPNLVVAVLRLDPLIFGEPPVRPFAYRPRYEAIARVRDLFQPGDWVVLDSRPKELAAEHVHAVRFRERVILSRVLAKRDSLLLLPSEGRSDVEVVDLPPGEPWERLVAGSLAVTIRGGS